MSHLASSILFVGALFGACAFLFALCRADWGHISCALDGTLTPDEQEERRAADLVRRFPID